MCGIAGVLRFHGSNFDVSANYVDRLRDEMALRGPDGAASWISEDRAVGLGFRRLAIIDLSTKAMQPMQSMDGTLLLCFNGEIYNHQEIRAELKALGWHEWRTDHSDAEVVIRAYEQWGVDCLLRLRGMFAFALWDARRRRLWLVRDRLGIKPLYYSVHHGRFVFASEIKALLRDPDQRRAVNEDALFDFLSFLTTPAPQTLFAGIRKLPAATWLMVDEHGHITENRYWDPFDGHIDLTRSSDGEIAALLIDELRTAVRLHCVSDVPVGIFLSGGIDSSTNTALFAEVSGADAVRTFSIGYRGDNPSYPNETSFARTMATAAGAEHHELLIGVDELLDFVPKMVRLQDEPIADPVCVPVYYVARLAREHGVKVCQVGEGADELFGGYPSWHTYLRLQRADRLPVPAAAKRLGLAAMAFAGRSRSSSYELLRRGAEGVPVFWSGADAFSNHTKHELLSRRLRDRFRGRTSWAAISPVRKRWEERTWDRSNLSWMTYADLNLRLPELLLMRVDKMSMGVSLEARVPFLDHKLVELAMSMPEAVKTRNSTPKSILRKAVRGIVPDELIDRPKQGFGVPVYDWVNGRLGERMRSEIASFADGVDLIDRDAALRILDAGDGMRTWFLFNLALWHREFIS
jgi:asparagine synthase (glutamine-hydrolysing)